MEKFYYPFFCLSHPWLTIWRISEISRPSVDFINHLAILSDQTLHLLEGVYSWIVLVLVRKHLYILIYIPLNFTVDMYFLEDFFVLVVGLKPIWLFIHVVVVSIWRVQTSSLISLHSQQVRHFISDHVVDSCDSVPYFKA